MTEMLQFLRPVQSAQCRVDNRWVEGSGSEMCHLQATVTFLPSSEPSEPPGFSSKGVEPVRHINSVLHKSHGGLEFS